MTDLACSATRGDLVPAHEQPLILARTPVHEAHGLARGLVYPCAVPGISLTDYSHNAQQKGWGGHCGGPFTTITFSNGVRITVDSRIAELVTLLMNETIRRGYVVRQPDTGAYVCRYISGTTIWSNHAWGLAVDIDWQTNPQHAPLITDVPAWMNQLWNRYGFAWGGDYVAPTRPDAMHREFMGTPAQAIAATALARAELGSSAPTPTPTPAPPVNDQVKADQANLLDTGFNPGPVDGAWGPSSVGACKRFQHAAHLAEDGDCGPATRSMLAKVPSWHTAPDQAGDGGYPASRWQTLLAHHGWHIAVDNVWGSHSASILAQFQADKHLTANGVRGPEAWSALFTQLN